MHSMDEEKNFSHYWIL